MFNLKSDSLDHIFSLILITMKSFNHQFSSNFRNHQHFKQVNSCTTNYMEIRLSISDKVMPFVVMYGLILFAPG
ncbi:hypothetical protein PCAR4_570168 [Paraburkholderia caribensis]|nr:hypothetical protein PCAR4_570168 [Paraburkholderia caribensis]